MYIKYVLCAILLRGFNSNHRAVNKTSIGLYEEEGNGAVPL